MSNKIIIKNGEGKNIKFTIKRDNVLLDVSSATFSFLVKAQVSDTTYLIEKADTAFDKSEGADGIIYLNIPADETTSALLPAGNYIAELKTIVTANTDVDKYEAPFIVEGSA